MTIINNEILDNIFNKELVVYENIEGFTIWVKYDGEDFLIKQNMESDPINMIDDSNETYYGNAIRYLNGLDERVKSLLPRRWWFIFEYMDENTIKDNKYSRLPKNNLVLTSIFKNNKLNYSVDEIEEFSSLLNVECLPFIFKGKLDEKIIEIIKYFLNTSKIDLEYVFGENSFAYFFYKLLNPQISQSFLMDDKFNDNIEKIILKINDNEINFSILNPLYKEISDENQTKYTDEYSLILINFLNFCQSINLNDLKIKGEKREQVYMNLICKLFNLYMNDVKDDILSWNFSIPKFYNNSKFLLNTESITNKLTIEYIEEPKLEFIFKCLYNSFKCKLDKDIEFGILTKNCIVLFNNYINIINNTIDLYFRKQSEDQLHKKGLIDFSDFVDIKYDKDSDGQVYPEILKHIKKGNTSNKKKGTKEGLFKKQ